MLLSGKVAVITGGGRGIGRAIALKFAGEGAAIMVAARTQSQIDAVAKEISDAGGRAAAVTADVAEEKHCERLLRAAESQFGRVDIHLRGSYLLTRLVLPGMYARGSGVILNISSLSAKSAFGWGSPYAAAKAGMLGLTRVSAAEAARKGVRVNAICPGPVTETKMSKDLGKTLAERLGVSPEKQLAGFLETVLQGRGQTADEIAAAALFLCSDHASAITGQSLNVDGGTAFY
jgi:NAD(P)-dependent dehydrogenase (short-subunit alcohol dehydrogenase family)